MEQPNVHSLLHFWGTVLTQRTVSATVHSLLHSPPSGTVHILLNLGGTVLFKVHCHVLHVHSLLHFWGTVLAPSTASATLHSLPLLPLSLCTSVSGVLTWGHFKQHPEVETRLICLIRWIFWCYNLVSNLGWPILPYCSFVSLILFCVNYMPLFLHVIFTESVRD